MKASVIAAVVVVVIIIVAAAGYVVLTSTKVTSTSTSTSTSSTQTSLSTSSTQTSSVSSNSSAATINIGIEEDLTTSLAAFSQEAIAMAQIAANQINAQGGIDGHKVVLYTVDELPDPVAAAQKLILQDHVMAVIGISYSGDAVAIMPLLAKYHVIGIWCTDSLNSLMANVTSDYNNYQYFFRLYPQDSAFGATLQSFFSNVTKPSSIYIVGEDLQFARESAVSVNASAQALGIKVLGETFVPLSQTDFSTLASQIGSLHPSAVVDLQVTGGATTFINQLRANPAASNIQVIYMGDGALDDPYVMGQVESSNPGILNGMVFTTFPGTNSTPYNSLTTSLATAYENMTHSSYYSLPSYTYSAVQILGQAIKSTGSLDPNVLVPALEKTNYNGPTGLVTFDSSHNLVFSGYWMLQIQSGKIQVVWPSNYATSSYQA
ncbi:MAG: ABC transporter substrate-binding protein [Thaumarchaeota archaeon]|nr:ABC transporter substrate-binding protein [Nitrososphaerota archaeon]